MKDFARYIPCAEEDCQEMLRTIGVKSVEELFESIPPAVRLKGPLNLPRSFSEPDLFRHIHCLQSPVFSGVPWTSFLGGGAYHHFIPAVVSSLTSRSEFYTAYTPYQPEISQGTLQAIFEYQTFMCQLTGMEVSNASMYDGASSLAEAVLMARRITKREKVLLSQALHPEYRRVIRTYIDPELQHIVEVPYHKETGRTDEDRLLEALDHSVGVVVIQSPNFFGIIEDLRQIVDTIHSLGALLVVGFSEAVAYGLLTPPGERGADIVAGEGQSFGIPISYGGPYLGIFATRDKYVRQMPGRLVGETVDLEGKKGFVLTLATREQHIRRQKATSNICTNEGLCALMATIFLSCLGKEGLRELALLNVGKTEYAKKLVSKISGSRLAFSGPTFNEFVLEIKEDPVERLRELKEERILGGLPLKTFFPELNHHLLVTVTEMITREEIDRWAHSMARGLSWGAQSSGRAGRGDQDKTRLS